MKRIIHLLLGKLGYRIVKIQDGPRASDGLDPFFALLKRLGFEPKYILDIGANRGMWTREALKFFPNARYTLVEPQDYLKAHIQDLVEGGSKIQWINAGASDHSGAMTFTISHRDDSSTFALTEEQARDAGLQQRVIDVMTLNEIAAAGGDSPDMVKIDAEGLDLRVLSGASDLLGRTDVFLVEAVVCAPGYENTAAEVIKFMANAGYLLIDVTDLNRSPKHSVLWVCELAFLRNGSALLSEADSYE
jgi:FkbM family methyltransferase